MNKEDMITFISQEFGFREAHIHLLGEQELTLKELRFRVFDYIYEASLLPVSPPRYTIKGFHHKDLMLKDAIEKELNKKHNEKS